MASPQEGASSQPPKLLERVRNKLRVLHLAKRTEEAYVGWIVRFIDFHREQNGVWVHPETMGGPEVSQFLTHLAVDRDVAASTQNQAFSALLFLYGKVLGKDLQVDALRAKNAQKLPTVLSKQEVTAILSKIPTAPKRLLICLLYGSGLRLMEACRLRVKDLDASCSRIASYQTSHSPRFST